MKISLIAGLLLASAWAFAAVPTPQSYFGHEIGADRRGATCLG